MGGSRGHRHFKSLLSTRNTEEESKETEHFPRLRDVTVPASRNGVEYESVLYFTISTVNSECTYTDTKE